MKQAYGDEAPAIWEALSDNIVTVTPGWSEAYGMFLEGEGDLVLSYTTSPAYHIIAEEDASKVALPFEEGHYMQIEVAGLVAGSDKADLAKSFLAFLVSDAAQSVIPTTNWMYPAVEPSAGLPEGFDMLITPAKPLLIAPEAASLFSAVVTLSMVSTPFLMLFARNLEFSPDRDGDELEGPDDAPRGSALVIGYGRFGQIVAQMLHAVDCSVTLIDKKPSQIELSGRFDTKVYFGDGLRLDLLRRAGAEEARVIIYCIDDATVDAEVLRPIVEAFPQAKILTRVFDRRQLMAIEGAGTGGAVREVFESSIALGLMALEKLDVDPRQMEDVEAALRQLDATRLAAQMDEGDLAAGKDHRFKPGGGRESASVLEKLRQRRQEAKAAARDEEAMQAADPESA